MPKFSKPKVVKVQFFNVGRGRANWIDEFAEFTDAELIGSIKKQKALVSRGIEVEYDGQENVGKIYVGGFRLVGAFKVI
jgi:hypothetical protein